MAQLPRIAAHLPRSCRTLSDVHTRPIGVFDSGFGGLTVARALIDLLPDQDIVYLGDTGRYPYGPRDLGEVRDFAIQIADYLVETYDIKLLVIACNTAAAAALDDLRTRLDIPVVGVIEPGLLAAAAISKTGQIGVVGTVGTVASGAYPKVAAEHGLDIDLTACACPGFVEFVERGETEGPGVTLLAERLLSPVKDAGVDTLLLGCTHYPYLARPIGEVMGRDVVLVSSADETAFEVRRLLVEDRSSGRRGTHCFISSGDASLFETIGRRLFGVELVGAKEHRWNS